MLDKANSHPWMANTVLQDLGGVHIFHTNLLIVPKKRECLKNIPIFYKEIISSWERIYMGKSCDLQFILSQSLWDNLKVKVRSKGKSISNKRLESKSILMGVDFS